MSGTALSEALCRAVRDGLTGAVEWRDLPRRRLYFFREGALVLVQSNLRSESVERVAERNPGVTGAELSACVAAARLYEGLGEAVGEVLVHPRVAAPEVEPLDVHALLWAAADRLPALPESAWPRAVPARARLLVRLPGGAEAVRYLLDLDGSRPLAEVLAFGPTEPDALARSLAVACALGAVEAGEPPSGSRVEAAPPIGGARAAPIEASARPTAGQPAPAPSAPASRGAAPTPAGSAAAGSSAAASASTGSASADLFGADDIADLIRGALKDAPAGGTTPASSAASAGGAAGARSSAAAPAAPFVAPRADAPVPAGDDIDAVLGSVVGRIRAAADHFGVLGTRWEDPVEAHRRAYFALAQRLHPDRVRDASAEVRDVAAELFERVREAWEVVGDDVEREAYIARVVRGEKSEDERAMEKVRQILDAEAEFKRGLAELNAGRLPTAHEIFGRVSAAVPEELEFAAHAAYTTFRLAQGRDEAAASAAARRVAEVVKANEKLDAVWVLHAIILRMTGRESAARQALVTALKLKPSNPDAVRELRRLDREGAKPAEAPARSGLFGKLFK